MNKTSKQKSNEKVRHTDERPKSRHEDQRQHPSPAPTPSQGKGRYETTFPIFSFRVHAALTSLCSSTSCSLYMYAGVLNTLGSSKGGRVT